MAFGLIVTASQLKVEEIFSHTDQVTAANDVLVFKGLPKFYIIAVLDCVVGTVWLISIASFIRSFSENERRATISSSQEAPGSPHGFVSSLKFRCIHVICNVNYNCYLQCVKNKWWHES